MSEKTHDDKAQIIIYDLMTDTPKKRKVLTRDESHLPVLHCGLHTFRARVEAIADQIHG